MKITRSFRMRYWFNKVFERLNKLNYPEVQDLIISLEKIESKSKIMIDDNREEYIALARSIFLNKNLEKVFRERKN